MDPVGTRSDTLRVQPSGLEVDFDKNMTGLYKAITNCDWEAAIDIAKRKPEQAKTWVVRYYEDEEEGDEGPEIMWRFLPIHSACARQPPVELVDALNKAYPDGVKCVDDQGMYALHYACGNQASRGVIRQLLTSFQEAAKIKCPKGMLPIHYLACWGPSSVAVIDMVLVANRNVAEERDENGMTPMDLAKEGQYPEHDAVVAALARWLGGATPTSTKRRSILKMEEKKEEAEEEYNYTTQSVGANSKTISRLKNEVNQFRRQQNKSDPTWADKKVSKDGTWGGVMNDLERRLRALEVEQSQGSNHVHDLQQDLQDSLIQLREKSMELKEVKSMLSQSEEENEGLRQALADLTEQHEKFKKKSSMMGDRLGSLNASLFSMMEQQTAVLDAMQAREKQLSALSTLRRNKMRELIEIEEQDPEEETDLKSILVKQTREMEAISAVIAAVRQQ